MAGLPIASLALGSAGCYIQWRAYPFRTAAGAKTSKDDPCRSMTRLKFLDGYLMGLIPYFRILLGLPTGALLWISLVSLQTSLNTFLAVESLRPGSDLLHLPFYPCYQLVTALFGGGIATPWLLVPALSIKVQSGPVHPTLAIPIAVGQFVSATMKLAVLTTAKPTRRKVIAWNVVINALVWIIWAVCKPLTNSLAFNLPDAVANFEALHFVVCGACVAAHIFVMLSLIGKAGAMVRAFKYVPATSEELPVHLLALEVVITWLSMLALVATDRWGGWPAAGRMALLSPALGPGAAFSMHVAVRETLVAKVLL